MQMLRSLLFYVFLYLLSAYCAIRGSHVGRLDRDALIKLLRWRAQVVTRYLLPIVRVKFVTNIEKLLDGEAVLISNHQSPLDAIVGHLIHGPRAVAYWAEQWLFSIPYFGECMTLCGMIPIDRTCDSIDAIRQPILLSLSALDRQDVVMIFPQGEYIPPGSMDYRINGGVHALYRRCAKRTARVPFFVASIDAGKCWAPKQFTIQPGTISFYVHPDPVPPGLDRAHFETWICEKFDSPIPSL